MANQNQKTFIKTSNKPPEPTHRVRTFFAALLGTIAVYLILMSVTVVWLNRTLTDTNTYVATVGPLVTKPDIQNYVADKVTDQIVQNASAKDLANQLLSSKAINAAQSDDQLKMLLKPVVKRNVLQVVQSQQFAALWDSTNRSAHSALVKQLDSNNTSMLSLDLSPAIAGVITQLRTTQLRPVAEKIKIKPDTGKLDFKNANISKIHEFYNLFKKGTIAIVLLAIAMAALSIWLSVHHGKTARRLLMTVGIIALIQAAILITPAFATFSSQSTEEQAAARAITMALLHNLQIASLVIGFLCIFAAIGSKLYVKYKH